ncbi:MAG: NADH:flavin oxidoreductase [Acidobacteria bacterium]|nr:NADH:flavin oxidoreductase [Acidobacteriota bacterium]
MHATTDSLFRPFPFGAKTLANRIVMAPMTRSKSPGGVPTPEVAAYYRRRTEGGVGLIITEGTAIDHPASSGYPAVPRIHGEDALAGWKRVVDEVHGAGGAIIPQLWHVGSVRKRGMEPDPEVPGFGPSAVPHPGVEGAEVPVEMSEADIAEVIDAFGRAAADAKVVGFDGVEIHGAHGYLIDQFFWQRTNRRTDRWGGDLAARSRFALEIVRAVRRAVGPDFPVIFRFSQWKSGGHDARLVETPEELERFLAPFVDAGVDIFHASTRRYWEPEFAGSELNLAGWTKKLTGKPAITVGSVGLDTDFFGAFRGASSQPTGIDELLRRLEAGEFDLVAVGRALLADPQWPMKIREGRIDEIEPFTPECLKILT